MTRSLTISPHALYEVEQLLAEPPFRGNSIGSTLADFYQTRLYLGIGQWTLKSAVRARLSHYYRYWVGLPTSPHLSQLEKGRILFTWLDQRASFTQLVFPVLEQFSPGDYHVIGTSAAMRSRLLAQTGFLTWRDLPRIDMAAWRREYRRCAPIWRWKLAAWSRKHGLPRVFLPHIELLMLIQSQRVMAFEMLLDRLAPSAVITEYDRNHLAAGLILAANQRAIPTMTMFHGVINPPYGYHPLLAKKAFCWGEQHRAQMLAMGADPEPLVITGCHHINRDLNIEAVPARRKVGLAAGKPIVLLATNPINPADRKKLARTFCEGTAQNLILSAAVRLHPSENLAFYREEIAAFPSVTFLENNAWSLDEALAAADVVVCHSSGMGNDAILKGKIAVILDVLDLSLGSADTLIKQAGAPVAKNAANLNDIITRIFSDPVWRQQIQDMAAQYVNYLCAAFGQDAARNVAALVRRNISGHNH